MSFFLGFAGRGPAPPFGDSNARDGRAIPPPRFCLRQNARTPQKRRGSEGPLGNISRWRIENLKYLDCSALPKQRTSERMSFRFGLRPPKAVSTLRDFHARNDKAIPAPRFSLSAKTLVRRKSAAAQKDRWVIFKIADENLMYLYCHALLKRNTS